MKHKILLLLSSIIISTCILVVVTNKNKKDDFYATNIEALADDEVEIAMQRCREFCHDEMWEICVQWYDGRLIECRNMWHNLP